MELTYLPNSNRAARVISVALGIGRADAGWLRERILEAAATRPTLFTAETPFGKLYVLDFVLTTTSGSAVVQ